MLSELTLSPLLFLLIRSTPSQSDVGVFTALESAPSAAQYPHSARWYSHIATWESEFKTLPGDAADGAKLFGGASASAPAAEEEEDDDEIDLFGSDDEEEVRPPLALPISLFRLAIYSRSAFRYHRVSAPN